MMRKILKWVGLGLLGLVLLGLLVLFAPVGYELATGLSATDLTNRTYAAADGQTLHAYLAEPAAEGVYPGVLLIHEWWGLTADITRIADLLAAEGYVVLAVDAYRGATTNQIPRAIYLATNTPVEQIAADLDTGLAYLRGLPNVDANRVASWGFCFGGRESFRLGTRHDDLAAVVDYYGGGVTVNEAADLGAMTGPFLGIFGADDASIPLDEVQSLERVLDEVGIVNEITVYQGVGHAFLDSDNLAEADHPAGQAWQQTLTFLDTHLR